MYICVHVCMYQGRFKVGNKSGRFKVGRCNNCRNGQCHFGSLHCRFASFPPPPIFLGCSERGAKCYGSRPAEVFTYTALWYSPTLLYGIH